MTKRRIYDEKTIERMVDLIIDKKWPNLSSEELEDMRKDKNILDKALFNLTTVDLESRLIEEYNGSRNAFQCGAEAMELMKNIPQELIQNVNEWLDDQPLTDIKIHGKSINDVMDMFKNTRPLTFIQVLHCFADWKKCNYFDEDFCFDYFSL